MKMLSPMMPSALSSQRGAPRRIARPAFPARRGFTLLEVLLVILITVLTMNLVGMALYQQLRIIEGTHGDVEQAQLARALLRNIGDDLRNVIKYAPMAVTLPSGGSAMAGAASALSSASGATGGTGDPTSGGGSGGGSSGSGTGGTSGIKTLGSGSGGSGTGGVQSLNSGTGGTGGTG